MPMSVNQFDQLKINKFLLRALDDMGFEEPTSIQDKVFSSIKAGKDVVGIAQTGTGKTFAYLLPALTNWKFTKSPYPQILILVPTRELVIQVEEEVKKLTEFMSVDVAGVFGGVNMQNHREAVSGRLDVVVGTPGRLMDLILCGALRTKDLKVLIIDEVDEMLNLGFRTQLRNIVELIPEKRQNLMFSATMIPEVEDVIHQFTSFYEKIEAAPSGAPLENIEQLAYLAPNFNSKANLLSYLLKQDEGMKKVLVFAGTRKMADALHKRMNEEFDDQVGVIHSSKAQNNRFNTVNRFADGTYRFIIATDIVARGLDVAGVSHVINFDLPSTSEQYVHRIGRTGRAEERGAAIAFVSEKELAYKASIEELMNFTIPLKEKPEEVDFTDELIGLETEKEHLASDNFYKLDDSGSAFHEKAKKNQKVNTKVRHKDVMHQKYGKPQTRGVKPKGKKKRK
jgi:ATP-dependent RNA helicase RhlE